MSGTKMTSCPSTCPLCDCALKAISLNSLRAHLKRMHGLSARAAWHMLNGNEVPRCTQCDHESMFISFQRGYELLCGKCNKKNSSLRAAETRRKRHHPAWNKGLTEETSESVKKASQGCRDYIKEHGHWCSGKTKENDESVRRRALKMSEIMKECWRSGQHGMIGKNGSNHEGVRLRGRSISNTFLTTERHWSYKLDAKDVVKRLIATRKRKIETGESSPFRLTEEIIRQRLTTLGSTWHIDDYSYSGCHTPVNVRCVTCDDRFTIPFNVLYKGKTCPTCFPPNFSQWHKQLYDYVLDIDPKASFNDRTIIRPKELDIVFGDAKFAIECNGNYWHSDACGATAYDHENKSLMASRAGCSLMHVFEDEWRDDAKRDIIKSMIMVKMHRAGRVLARNLVLRQGTAHDVNSFIGKNHIDGAVRASHSFWLVDDNDDTMIALTLREPHQRRYWGKKTIEIARIATMLNTVVVGGVSRLVSAASSWARENSYSRMITYRDTRLGGTGMAYDRSGFSLSHVSQPRFWWTDGFHRFDRFMVKAIPNVMTQEELAMDLKLHKIWGCSNVVYIKNI